MATTELGPTGAVRASTSPALEADDIDFSYGRLQVLFRVSLFVEHGEALALLGTNGAGFFTDLTPIFILFLIPAIQRWQETRGATRRAAAVAFAALAAWGVFTHGHGATSIAANQWSALPVNVDTARWRVWDWSDPQFLRGLK